ncbi:MAG: hypothetical protein ACFFC6_05990 [Promethearchaeota archaeon]
MIINALFLNPRCKLPVISKYRKFIVLIILLLNITTTFYDTTLTTADLTKEEGFARFNRIICTDTGLCLIFYHRLVSHGDVCEAKGPFVKAVNITPLGKITYQRPSINFSMNADVTFNILYNNDFDVHEVQEEGDAVRLIGYNEGTLYEIWYFKNNNSVLVKEKKITEWWEYERFYQWLYQTQITNYTLVGIQWSNRENESLQLVIVDFHSVEKISIPRTLGFTGTADQHFYDGNNSVFLIYIENYPSSRLIINQLFLNGSMSNCLVEELGLTSRRYGSLFRNKDEMFFLGIRCYDPFWQDSLTQYNHTFYLINFASKQFFSHSFLSQDSTYRWDVLLDSEGHPHVILHEYFATRFLKFSPYGELLFQSVLLLPETGRANIPRESFTLFQDTFLIGGYYEENYDAGIFVLNISTGKIIDENKSLLPSIEYSPGLIKGFGVVFVLLVLLISIISYKHILLTLKRYI